LVAGAGAKEKEEGKEKAKIIKGKEKRKRNSDNRLGPKIIVSKNGPYMVTGKIPLSIQIIKPNRHGLSWDWVEGKKFHTGSQYALCRCGHSKNMPFCDGTHQKIGFDCQEAATRMPYARQAKKYDGPTMVLMDAENLRICAILRSGRPDMEPDRAD